MLIIFSLAHLKACLGVAISALWTDVLLGRAGDLVLTCDHRQLRIPGPFLDEATTV